MIKVENIEVYNIARAIYSARNPLNSWAKSDSDLDGNNIGENDLALAKRLYQAGSEHRKYLRQIFVTMDITAPLYWISEFDTYKVGTARNSCSFMHKGVSKPFEITDFSIHDGQVYEILSPLPKKRDELIYPENITPEYRIYECENGRKYRIYNTGRVVSEAFECIDVTGRARHFQEKECRPSITPSGYYELSLGGRQSERWMLHRLIAAVWIDNPNGYSTVNHIDGNKGNNCVSNLEWLPLEDNIRVGFENGLFENGKSLHTRYIRWKNGFRNNLIDPFIKFQIKKEHKSTNTTYESLANKYGLTYEQTKNILNGCECENSDLFLLCLAWEKTIENLNRLRLAYMDTHDNDVFQKIRCMLPCGYNQRFTVTMNYENVVTMIKQRTGHKLDEWNDFIGVLKTLPYIEEIMGD